MTTYRAIGAATLAVLAIALATRVGTTVTRVAIQGSFVQSSLPDLVKHAQAVAIVEMTAAPSEHWNSEGNKSWGTLGVDSFIYRDVPLKVVTVLSGSLPSTLTVRDLGGTADGFEFVFDGSADWEVGSRYLVFLEWRKFPVREGTEESWTPVRLCQGVFSWTGHDWFEHIQDIHIAADGAKDVVALLPPR